MHTMDLLTVLTCMFIYEWLFEAHLPSALSVLRGIDGHLEEGLPTLHMLADLVPVLFRAWAIVFPPALPRQRVEGDALVQHVPIAAALLVCAGETHKTDNKRITHQATSASHGQSERVK
eukprot:4682695-Pyramimonas_sp.AAC.1